MKRNDYIIIALLLFTWMLEDAHHLAPREFWIYPFPFSEKKVTIQRYIYDIIMHAKFAIFVICILMKRKSFHWLLVDVIKITLGLILFSVGWYLMMYGNPEWYAEWWIKFVSILLIYVSIKAIRYHANSNNSIFSRFFRRGV